MNRMLSAFAMAVCAAAAPAHALTTIDFESFADAQNLNGVDLGGVTITNPSGNVEIFDNRFGVASRSGSKAIGSFSGAQNINPMVFTFDSAVSFVELFGGDRGGDIDTWSLEIFDAQIGGNSLGIANAPATNGNPYVGLSFSTAGILRAEAVWTGSEAGIGFDDLSFENGAVIPLPAPALLLMSGLVGLAAFRRRG